MKVYQLILVSVVCMLCPTTVFGRYVVCYYANWSQYRSGTATFVPEDIDPKVCTHIIFAFAQLVANKLAPTEWNDAIAGGLYARINALKQINRNLKTLLAVGGFGVGVEGFTKMVASASNRAAFVTDTITYLRRFNFDGLDLDWEYPAARGSPAVDKKRFTQLVSELKKGFQNEAWRTGNSQLLLTAAVSVSRQTVAVGYEVAEISRYLDFINLMSYDLHGSWDSSTGHNSPLYARSNEFGNHRYLNVEASARNWVNLGAPRSKIVIGMGMYGRTFRLASSSNTGMGAPAVGAGSPGPLTQTAGFMAYYEVCDFIESGWRRYWHSEHQAPYAVRGTEWVGYDDVQSIQLKSEWLKREGYAGGMIWSIDLDDFGGECNGGRYPLLRTLYQQMKSNVPPRSMTSRTTTTTTIRTTTAAIRTTAKKCWWWCPRTTVRLATRPTTRPTTRRTTQRTTRRITTTTRRALVAFKCPRDQESRYYPDPNDCAVFHVCINGYDFRMMCGGSTLYNPNLKNCDYPKNVKKIVNCY